MYYKKLRKVATVGISSLLIGSQVLSVSADTADDIAYLEQQQAQANAELSYVYGTINDLQAQKEQILAAIDAYDAELVVVIATINSLDQQIADKEKELVKTGKDLVKAEKDRDIEYEAMKERIRYLYEEGGNAGWAAMLLAEGIGISNIIDKVSHTQQLYDYDRKELDAYTASIEKVDALQKQQTEQKSALQTMKREQEEGKSYLEKLLVQAEQDNISTDSRLAEANDLAAQYLYLIDQQNAAISELYWRQEQERIAAEEAAAAAAAAAAAEEEARARQAAAAQAAVAASAPAVYEEESYDGGSDYSYSDNYSSYDDGDYDYDYDSSSSYSGSSSSSSGTSSYTSSGSGVSGQDVVNYALQYVGNPYVWGGTDPNNGADCSGFVQSVYRDLGYDISRTTYTQLNDGVSVSYADAQPGDLINYGSHVAIYMGDNQIVHAANEQLGITTSTNATYQPIVDVRRIITD